MVDPPGEFPHVPIRDLFPTLQVRRGGISFDMTSAEAQRRQAEQATYRALIERWIGNVQHAQDLAINEACVDAFAHGWDVHLQRHWQSRFIGIELAEREHPPLGFPVVFEHPESAFGESSRWSEWD